MNLGLFLRKKFNLKRDAKREIFTFVFLAVFFLVFLILFFLIMICLSTNSVNSQEKKLWKYKGEIREVKNSEKWEKENISVLLITTKELHQACINTTDREIQVDYENNHFSIKIFKIIKEDSIKGNLKNISFTQKEVADLKKLYKARKKMPDYKINSAFELLLKKIKENCGRIKSIKKLK